jgi:NAD(P)-dependent dehydrogenase (short-subunit alcohol dehydrogenase family)
VAKILVTGASKGIGRATALELINRGHEVIATARNPADLADVPAASRLKLDVVDASSVQRAAEAVGAVDVVISNAGQVVRGPIETTPVEMFTRLYDANTLGAVRVAQGFLPGMRRQGSGRLLFVSSVVGRLALPLSGAYAATKWALEAIAETLALETAPFGIEVGVFEPGRVGTGAPQAAPNFLTENNPYHSLLSARPGAGTSIRDEVTPEFVAAAVADAVDADSFPLRIPVGPAAKYAMEDLRAAPDNEAFAWVPRVS